MTDIDRIVALEERIAYQDQTIEDLNQTILQLWKELEGIRRQIGKLGNALS